MMINPKKMNRADTPIVHQRLPQNMENEGYSILVRPYAFGQYRIQLTKVGLKDPWAPKGHGAIVREMCTYDQAKAHEVVDRLAEAEDPEQTAEGYAEDWNCEYPGGRIRLDNTPEDRS